MKAPNFKPLFLLIPLVEAYLLQSRRKRKDLEGPVSACLEFLLSTFQIQHRVSPINAPRSRK